MIMPGKPTLSALLTIVGIIANNANAALFDRGNGLIFDDTLNVSWIKDANVFSTLANQAIASGPGGYGRFIDQIISVNSGKIYDTRSYLNPSGIYNLHGYDFGSSSGELTWWGAAAFIGYLNNVNYLGFDDWRLPDVKPINGTVFTYSSAFRLTADGSDDQGLNITSTQSELAYNFNVNLNNPNYRLPDGSQNPNWTGIANPEFEDSTNNVLDSFINLQSYGYWSGLDTNYIPGGAWYLSTYSGAQDISLKTSYYSVWAVRSGDSITIPEPNTITLLFIGVFGFICHRKIK